MRIGFYFVLNMCGAFLVQLSLTLDHLKTALN